MIDEPRSAQSSTALFSRRRLLHTSGACLLLSLMPVGARAATVSAVRVWPAYDYTRVTLEHDNDLKFTHFMIESPDRLVVDIEGVDLNATLRDLVSKITPNDPYIRAVRIGQNKPHVVRLVLDLKQPIKPQVFSLAPVAQFQHRLIFDLYPTEPADPILALLQKEAITPTPSAPALVPFDSSGMTAPALEPPAKLDATPPHVAAPELLEPPAINLGKGKANVTRLITIAIDPGHGGEDPGATGRRGTHEKDIVLKIAKRVKAQLDKEPNMRAMLTRDGDYFVPLQGRVDKARRVQADLFISLHADAFINKEANGSSVFVLSERGATSTAANWIAQKENDADLIGGVNIDTKDQQLARVLLDLSTTAQINDSLKLGDAVLNHLGRINRLHKPRVEQAGFAVLKAPDIPSILIETAFISNPDEEKRLNDPQFQQRLAESIVTGVKRYFAKNPPLAKSKLAGL